MVMAVSGGASLSSKLYPAILHLLWSWAGIHATSSQTHGAVHWLNPYLGFEIDSWLRRQNWAVGCDDKD